MTEGWSVTPTQAMAAHFRTPEGGSAPGIEVALLLRHGGAEHHCFQRVMLGPAGSGAQQRAIAAACQHAADQLAAGWRPDHGALPVIALAGGAEPAPPKPGFWRRLFGR